MGSTEDEPLVSRERLVNKGERASEGGGLSSNRSGTATHRAALASLRGRCRCGSLCHRLSGVRTRMGCRRVLVAKLK